MGAHLEWGGGVSCLVLQVGQLQAQLEGPHHLQEGDWVRILARVYLGELYRCGSSWWAHSVAVTINEPVAHLVHGGPVGGVLVPTLLDERLQAGREGVLIAKSWSLLRTK